jgi:hypothetical protein
VRVLSVIQELAAHESCYGEFDQKHLDKISVWQQDLAEKRLNHICEKYLQS